MKNNSRRVRVREAIEFYNSNPHRVITLFDLAQTVIRRQIAATSRYQLLAKYNKGSEDCPPAVVKRIAQELGVTTDFLHGHTEHPTLEHNIADLLTKYKPKTQNNENNQTKRGD